MKLSEKLMKIRKENGLSQEEFGNEINVSRQAVSKWESEQTKPDIDKIQEIAKRFNVSFDYLLNDEIDTQDKKVEEKSKKKKSKIILKIILIIVGIYLLILLYKFIALYRFYKIADSFSEENYFVSKIISNSNMIYSDDAKATDFIQKIGNKLQTSRYGNMNQDGEVLPFAITFVDTDADYACELSYDSEKEVYFYEERDDVQNVREMIEANGPREFTLRNYSIRFGCNI